MCKFPPLHLTYRMSLMSLITSLGEILIHTLDPFQPRLAFATRLTRTKRGRLDFTQQGQGQGQGEEHQQEARL